MKVGNFQLIQTAEGINTIIKTGKVDYKYVTAEGNTVLEENKTKILVLIKL